MSVQTVDLEHSLETEEAVVEKVEDNSNAKKGITYFFIHHAMKTASLYLAKAVMDRNVGILVW
jgi:hypothetical protein